MADEQDVVVVAGPTPDEKGARVLRFKGDTVSFGEVRALEDGKPILDRELIRLSPREGAPQVCDVEVIHAAPSHKGPARVSNASYRSNWELVFGLPAVPDRSAN